MIAHNLKGENERHPVDVQNLLNESTTQNTTNDKNLPKNFNLCVLMTKELQEK